MPFMWVWLRLTIMKLASRKNMMSINGMISIRCSVSSELARILSYLVGSPRHGECDGNVNLGNVFQV
jgi:hypothetical protein